MKTNTGPAGKRRFTVSLVLAALFAAMIAAGMFIAVPLPVSPVPIVLQNFFALLAGLVLGPALGGAAVGLYFLAGILGAPVFAGGTGGIARFFGPTGGFLAGYLLAALCAGLIAGRPRAGKKTPLWRIAAAAFAGILVIYVPGLLRLAAVLKPEGNVLRAVLAAGFFPFLPGDLVKAVLAALIAPRLRGAAAAQLEQ